MSRKGETSFWYDGFLERIYKQALGRKSEKPIRGTGGRGKAAGPIPDHCKGAFSQKQSSGGFPLGLEVVQDGSVARCGGFAHGGEVTQQLEQALHLLEPGKRRESGRCLGIWSAVGGCGCLPHWIPRAVCVFLAFPASLDFVKKLGIVRVGCLSV